MGVNVKKPMGRPVSLFCGNRTRECIDCRRIMSFDKFPHIERKCGLRPLSCCYACKRVRWRKWNDTMRHKPAYTPPAVKVKASNPLALLHGPRETIGVMAL